MIPLAQDMTAKSEKGHLFSVRKILKYNFGNSGGFRNKIILKPTQFKFQEKNK